MSNGESRRNYPNKGSRDSNTILNPTGTVFYMIVSINPYEVLTQGNVFHLKGKKRSNNCAP